MTLANRLSHSLSVIANHWAGVKDLWEYKQAIAFGSGDALAGCGWSRPVDSWWGLQNVQSSTYLCNPHL